MSRRSQQARIVVADDKGIESDMVSGFGWMAAVWAYGRVYFSNVPITNSNNPSKLDTLPNMAADAIKTTIPTDPAPPVRKEFIAIMVVVAIFAIIYLVKDFMGQASDRPGSGKR
ncbi:hypothetical protein L211DRAFT_869230 [Terfezia boudieri ATCC MYA-4762]|uniref:Uncharacterized protein n=1 Tax=Terfezia boudieri ATCC MYA-4762 TaxID=1051890 RepID=A0A3N4LHS2_9PEZI|nr:hypothetical protein L211DRAFT_869230 [Terfezia boudieri ATCC MYA-4762]